MNEHTCSKVSNQFRVEFYRRWNCDKKMYLRERTTLLAMFKWTAKTTKCITNENINNFLPRNCRSRVKWIEPVLVDSAHSRLYLRIENCAYTAGVWTNFRSCKLANSITSFEKQLNTNQRIIIIRAAVRLVFFVAFKTMWICIYFFLLVMLANILTWFWTVIVNKCRCSSTIFVSNNMAAIFLESATRTLLHRLGELTKPSKRPNV